ncbi:hypothetical protein MVLG_06539 [Microbotryum lychnidis-dioicae p1A1 Lamole]|uniref:peptide-methionine (S)-S-oxide reductase n=1 Tax=Microbotryum lychnidis-dioicae (strain p1A1 Lamole / MvSl-1064) TaxID=683840 RepID=U5HHK9_USTV1|nr:hypothetical protein MVLG_06539 [Microbotryum lychnidis-dioicae p1A1 Lamole]|eukprot:KDE02942.1 hypothetical protein MVLG_06539 [Microbotryum lychnidis-dioicae p1A1 Lamole]
MASRTPARNTLAALPRSLRIAPSTPITRTHLLALYKEQLRVASSFGSYNFRQYFLRRTRDKFRSELPSLLDAAYNPSAIASGSSAASSSSSTSAASTSASTNSSAKATNPVEATSEDNSIYAPTRTEASAASSSSSTTTTPETRLREWYAETLSDLAVMARAAIVNGLYEAPKLVIEGRAKMMVTGGGGAGADASYGGGGQPANVLKHFKGLFAAATVHAYTGPTLPTAIQSQRSLSTMSSSETAIFANGCFWGTEHMFRKHFIGQGLKDAKVGYIGGKTSNPSYREVCSGSTQHAEAVKLEFDPSQLSYATLVEFHYRMHDPTQVDRQGPDRGTQYRSAIFTTSDEQAEIAKKVTKEVQEAHFPNDKVATKIEPAGQWWDAETYHQEYLDNNPGGYECPTHRLHW